MTHHPLMKCICVTYEVIPSNSQGATERTRPKVQTTRVTFTFDLLTSKWYATHHPLIRCICAPYEEIPWNNQGATERTRPKVQTAHVTLTFDLLTSKWYATHHPPIRCICAPYEEIPSNNEGATERTRHAGRTDGRGETNIPPTQLRCAGGITTQLRCAGGIIIIIQIMQIICNKYVETQLSHFRDHSVYVPSQEKPVLFSLAVCMRRTPGSRLNKKDCLSRNGDSHVKDKTAVVIPMLKIRRPSGRLIFNMGITIPCINFFFHIETGSSYALGWGQTDHPIFLILEDISQNVKMIRLNWLGLLKTKHVLRNKMITWYRKGISCIFLTHLGWATHEICISEHDNHFLETLIIINQCWFLVNWISFQSKFYDWFAVRTYFFLYGLTVTDFR